MTVCGLSELREAQVLARDLEASLLRAEQFDRDSGIIRVDWESVELAQRLIDGIDERIYEMFWVKEQIGDKGGS